MSATLSLPPTLVARDFMLGVFHRRRLLLLIFGAVAVGTIQIAVSITPNYKARSTLLVLLGTEHGFRPAAGQQVGSSANVEIEQVLRTEASIIGSDDLHRSVIRDIGVDKLFPKLLAPPSYVTQKWNEFRSEVIDLIGLSDSSATRMPPDPLAMAVEKFDENLTVSVDKKSSVITIDFTNPDKDLAARAIALLEERYLSLRGLLYGDVQAPIIRQQKDEVGKNLSQADVALEDFKRTHDIASFADRRAILMKQQGDLEAAVAKAQATSAENHARIDQLNNQLVMLVGKGKGAPNAASALQGMVDAYRKREATVQNTYRGSTSADDAHRQMLERETDIAKMQSTEAFALQAARDKAIADLHGSDATFTAVTGQLTDLNNKINALNADEMELHRLERNRGILEDNFKAVNKILDERQVIETIDANRQSSVRVIQPPHPPLFPLATRKLILVAGMVTGVLLAALVALTTHFMRAVYFRPEALEIDTGLAVLATIPETRSIARSSAFSVIPSPGR